MSGTESSTTGTTKVVLRLEGDTWTVSDQGSAPNSRANAITCLDRSNCLAVGQENGQALAERWDGDAWTEESIPNPPGTTSNTLNTITCPNPGSCLSFAHSSDITAPPFIEVRTKKASKFSWGIKTIPSLQSAQPVSSQPSAPKIVSQPQDQTCAVGGTANFRVEASGTFPLTYQWQSSTDRGTTWTNVPGGTAPGWLPQCTSSANGTLFRVTVANSRGTQVSNPAKEIVK